MDMHRKLLGRRAEDIAASFLKKNGISVIDRNFACRLGEIDIVGREGEEIVFVEVRSACGTSFCDPLESITAKKIDKLRRLACVWLANKSLEPEIMRFDVIAVVFLQENKHEIRHIRDAFQ